MNLQFTGVLGVVVCTTLGVACVRQQSPTGAPSTASGPPAENAAPAITTIDHLEPARDSTGSTPPRFAWTAVDGADRYGFGLWNDVDILIWRQDGLSSPSVTWPAELRVEFGTYFWSVTALRGDRVVGESGRAAFVILR